MVLSCQVTVKREHQCVCFWIMVAFLNYSRSIYESHTMVKYD